ncbi:polysaccharide pyruvyl transferase family protein [Oceanirhabdus seepicola]|uniref:Polysaccharide pyruvyl transferase family protein n=1 Tax=Oceanirhabdus seepicola TaxID=2828781 RepID=A0A9J6PCB6_9CLOT|nr:polysaccharide pyruvyl transferase family protein [Oceanirhabdus seepicola]MCM1992629.1 polysaccharide pyruvyl transferase family protein [Oceanirhabdus seepicola]
MKYANIKTDQFCDNKTEKKICNIGDFLQFIIIDSLYDEMGINKEEVIRINFKDIKSYRGEYIALPLNYSIFNENFMTDGKFDFPDRIVPIFLACTLTTIGLNGRKLLEDAHNVRFLKRHEPIGCRDEYTMTTLREFGIEAYLSGCLTVTLPKTQYTDNEREGVYFVDAPYSIKKYLPEGMLEKAVVTTQQYYFSNEWYENPNRIFDFTKDKYKEYSKAKLVVTSRMHVASPCIAMGIPVILVKDDVDYRFGWIDKYIPVYSYEEFSKINWEPKPVECEKEKAILRKAAIGRIKMCIDKYQDIYFVSQMYENTEHKKLKDFFGVTHKNFKILDRYFQECWDENSYIEYAIWGLTNAVDEIYEYIQDKYPKAKLVKVIDSFKNTDYRGIRTEKPNILTGKDSYYTIVASVGASNDAKMLFEKIGKKEEMYCLLGTAFL